MNNLTSCGFATQTTSCLGHPPLILGPQGDIQRIVYTAKQEEVRQKNANYAGSKNTTSGRVDHDPAG
ncbi:MAG: hypothetical protein HQK60_01160 [Deltaproteobacteria bacterium]|nr:hypothetical protein [Deltaproteobacteria bacterium]